MATVKFFLICSFVVVFAEPEVTLEADRTWLRVKLFDAAELKCCYTGSVEQVTWIKHFKSANSTLNHDVLSHVPLATEQKSEIKCNKLNFKSVQLSDSGLYRCRLNVKENQLFTHGTYLQVYKPIEKTINISESTKNNILTVEGILLLLCVLAPSATLLFKSKKLHGLEKKKMKKEEENIYQGLNLDDCCTTYDQIERFQVQGPYQDVGNMIEEEEEIQLEKP